MADQLTDHVKAMQAAGVDEAEIIAFIQQFGQPVPSHDPPNRFDEGNKAALAKVTGIDNGLPTPPPAFDPRNDGTRMSGGRGPGGFSVAQADRAAYENAPAVGAAIAAAPFTGGWSIPAAFVGGASGAALRGDDTGGALWEGGKQALLQSAPKIIQGLSKATYNTGIPQNVLKDFRGVDVAGAGLENRAILGTTQGVRAAERGGARAAQQIDAAAPSVPPMFDNDIRAAFNARSARADLGSRPGAASDIDTYVKASMGEVGPFPQSGAQQLARRAELQPEAVVGNAVAANAASNPAFANIERKALTQNLRRSPAMAKGLDAQQATKGLREAALAQEFSTPLSRLRSVGVKDAMFLPTVSSALGIAGNEVSKAIKPDVARLLLSLMSSHDQ